MDKPEGDVVTVVVRIEEMAGRHVGVMEALRRSLVLVRREDRTWEARDDVIVGRGDTFPKAVLDWLRRALPEEAHNAPQTE